MGERSGYYEWSHEEATGDSREFSDATKIDSEQNTEAKSGSFYGQNPSDQTFDAAEEAAGDATDEALGAQLEAAGETPGNWFDTGVESSSSESTSLQEGEVVEINTEG